MNKIKVWLSKVRIFIKRKKKKGMIGNVAADKIMKLYDEIEDELIVAERKNDNVDMVRGKFEVINKIIKFIEDDKS